MTAPVTMTDAIRQAVLYQLSGIHTALPASIISYDYTTQKAQVQPLLNKVWSSGQTMAFPVVNNIPVIFPSSGGASLTFPVNPGDTCLLLFIERSIDLWKSQGGQVSPDDPRKFDLSDAVAIMGLNPFSTTSPAQNNTDVLLTYAGSSITIKPTGDMVLDTSGTIAIGNSTTEVLNVIESLLNILSTSVTTALGNPIQQVAIPPTADTYSTLQAAIHNLKGMI